MLTPTRAARLLARAGQTDSDLIARLTNAELRALHDLRAGRPIATARTILAEIAGTALDTPQPPQTKETATMPKPHSPTDAYALVIKPLRASLPRTLDCVTAGRCLGSAIDAAAMTCGVSIDGTSAVIAARVLDALGAPRAVDLVRINMMGEVAILRRATQADAA